MEIAQKVVEELKEGKTLSGQTKKVKIHLAALTRQTYTEEVEVPVEFNENDLDHIVYHTYDNTDGSEFVDDQEFWEKGQCYYEEEE